MSRSNGYHLRIPQTLRDRLKAVQTGIEIAGDSRRLTPHPKISQLFIALADDLCARFEAGESVVTLPILAALSATQAVMKNGKPTKGRHLAPIATVELYTALSAAPRLLTFDEEMLMKQDARRLVIGKACLRGKVFTDPGGETEALPVWLNPCKIVSIKGGWAQVDIGTSMKNVRPVNVFDLIPEHEADRQRAALELGR